LPIFYSRFSDLCAYGVAKQAQTDADSAAAEARAAQTETELMRADIDRLLMITEALWTFLKKEHGYTDEDLAGAITQIDMRDGLIDGKGIKSAPQACPDCGRMNSALRALCIYCGKAIPLNPFAR
jgi:hypothetical protein